MQSCLCDISGLITKKILSKPHVLITSYQVQKIGVITRRKTLMPTDDHQNWLNKNKIWKVIIKKRTFQCHLETRAIKSKKKKDWIFSLFQNFSATRISNSRLPMAILPPRINGVVDIVKCHKNFSFHVV